MADLQISIDGGRTSFRPGETISGSASWRLKKTPKKVAVNLLWYTGGTGDEDREVVASKPIANPRNSDECDFAFTLPAEPYSFSGRLITLVWIVELNAGSKKSVVQQAFTLSPTGNELNIAVDYDVAVERYAP